MPKNVTTQTSPISVTFHHVSSHSLISADAAGEKLQLWKFGQLVQLI